MSRASSMLEALNQYVNNDRIYKPVTDTKKILLPGVYEIKSSMEGVFFEKVNVNTDALIKINTSKYNYLMEEIRNFWDSADEFKEMEMMNKRAFMLHSIPGTGKSCILKQVMGEMTENGNITFIGRDAGVLVAGLKLFREVEENRKALVIVEEVDEMINYGGAKALADLLDGPDSINDIFYLGTTNHLDRIPERLLRPSRFDRLVEVESPSKEDRYEYFKAKMAKKNVDEKTLQTYVEATDKFTFADMKEFLVSVVCLKNDIKETVNRLRKVKPDDKNAYRGYDDVKDNASSNKFSEALVNETVDLFKLDEKLTVSTTESSSMDITITLERGLNQLIGMSLEDTQKWLEEMSKDLDVETNPEFTTFKVSGPEADKFKLAIDNKIAVMNKKNNIVPNKEEEEEIETLTVEELGWKPGKFAMVLNHNNVNYYKKESHKSINGELEYVLYVSKDGKKLKVMVSANENDDELHKGNKPKPGYENPKYTSHKDDDSVISDDELTALYAKVVKDNKDPIKATTAMLSILVKKYKLTLDDIKILQPRINMISMHNEESLEEGDNRPSVEIKKDGMHFAVYQNSNKLKGGFVNQHLAADWAAKHFKMDPDMFRESNDEPDEPSDLGYYYSEYGIGYDDATKKYKVYEPGVMKHKWDVIHTCDTEKQCRDYIDKLGEGKYKEMQIDNDDKETTTVEFSNLGNWKRAIEVNHPNAKITKEDGSGKTYGEVGSHTAHTGPDMQADVVGTFDTDDKYGWIDVMKTLLESKCSVCGSSSGIIKSIKDGLVTKSICKNCSDIGYTLNNGIIKEPNESNLQPVVPKIHVDNFDNQKEEPKVSILMSIIDLIK